jgi:hypothetical protein
MWVKRNQGVMMNDTFDLIQNLSTERQNLYFLAGKQHLTAEQLQRLDEITGKLPTLWDAYRREYASQYRLNRPYNPIPLFEGNPAAA